MQKNKVIVTGGAGFIGSHLVERLVELNFKVIVIDNLYSGSLDNLKHLKNKIQFYKLDISKKNNLEKLFKKTTYVFHLAALADIVPSIENPELYFKINVQGTLNILEASKKNNIRKIIYAASSSCYGIPKNYPTNEKENIVPQYPYALTKYLGEQLIIHWSKVYNVSFVSLRLFNVYGLKSRTTGTYGAMFGIFLAQKINNKPFTIVGNGQQTRDFTYVTDVVEAMIIAAKSKVKNNIFNIGSGNTYSVNKIVKLLGGKKIFLPKKMLLDFMQKTIIF